MKKNAILIISILLVQEIFACDYDKKSFLWWYFKSDLICTCKVIKVFENDSISYNVKILVDRVYKGNNLDTLQLKVMSYPEWSSTISDCDVYMKIGDQQLIYAKKENNTYVTGGLESRSGIDKFIRKYNPQEYNWLETINSKVSDFYWKWNELDKIPIPYNFKKIVNENFNIQVLDSNTKQGSWILVLCDIDEQGNLMKSNLFSGRMLHIGEFYRETYEKFEYLNPEIKCITNFEKEAVRVTKLINKWTPGIFCDKFVKSQMLIRYTFDNNKIFVSLN